MNYLTLRRTSQAAETQKRKQKSLISSAPACATNLHMRSLVYLTTRLPSQVSGELELAGFQVFEALEISEVWYLCEHKKIDAVVIAPDVDDQDRIEIQLHRATIKMKPETSARDILWELANLFPDPRLQVH